MTTTRLIVVDSAVVLPEAMLASLPEGSSVLRLQTGEDSLAQITAAAAKLAQQGSPVDTLDLISHGGQGFVLLDGQRFDAASVQGQAQELAALGAQLAPGADWLLYGCSVAAGAMGEDFVALLALASGADVAASDNATGAASLGGDWALEFQRGDIASASVFNTQQAQEFEGLLVAAPPSNNTSYSFAGAQFGSGGTVVTADGFFTLTAASSNPAHNFPIKADEYGAYIDEPDTPAPSDYTSALIFTATGSFYFNGAVIGEYYPSELGGVPSRSTEFSQIIVIGYAGGVEVARTAPYNSIANFETNYNIDYSPLQGKQLDTLKIQFDIAAARSGNGLELTDYFNVESLNISGASYSPPQPAIAQAPTLTATPANPTFNEDVHLAVDLFSNVSASAVENAQNIDRITLTIAGLADGAAEVLRVDGRSVSLVDGASTTTPTLGAVVSVSVSAATATVTIEKAGGLSAANASALIDGLGYRNTANLTGDSTRVITLTGLRDTGDTTNGGANSQTFNIASTVAVKQGALTDDVVDVLWNHNTSQFAAGYVLTADAALGASDSSQVGVFLAPEAATTQTLEVSADGLNVGSFDLTGLTLEKFQEGVSSNYIVTIIGTKFDASPQVFATLTSAPGSSTFTAPDLSQFTGLSKYSILIQGTASAAYIALDSFRVANVVQASSAPVLAQLGGDLPSFVEGSAFVLLDVGSDAIVSDSDSADFNGGKLTVAITAGASSAEDVLAIRSAGTGSGQIGVSGLQVTYEGNAIGTVAGGNNGLPLTITFDSAAATPAAVTALLQSLSYSNTNVTAPSTAARSVSISLEDGDGGSSTAAVVTVSVTGVNDAPTVAATAFNPTFTEDGSPVLLFTDAMVNTIEAGQSVNGLAFTVSNVADGASEIFLFDGAQIALTHGNSGMTSDNALSYSVAIADGTATLTLAKAGGLSAATVQTLLNAAAYGNTSQNPTNTSRVVTLVSITDSGGTANGGVDTSSPQISSVVSVVALNDAPTLSGGPLNLAGTNEDTVSAATLVTALLTGLGHSDADGAGASGVAITATTGNGSWEYSSDGVTWQPVGTVSQASALLLSSTSQVRYQPDQENGETATLTVRAWDQSSGLASANGSRSTADTLINGGSSAFSAGTASAQVVVSGVNDAPTNLTLSNSVVAENSNGAGGKLVGTLSSTDVDTGETFSYSIQGGADAAAFVINGNALEFKPGAVLDFETQSSYAITLRSTDGNGLSFDKDFTVTLTDVNEAPGVGTPMGIQTVAVQREFSFAVPAGAFIDPDAGDTLTYSATYPNGQALPGWLSLDPITGVFSGTPPQDAPALLPVQVTVTDSGTAPNGPYSASSTFFIMVSNGPSVSSVVRAQGADELSNATSVVYTVTFSEAVSGVDAADFSLATTGTAGGTVSDVHTDDGITYTVTVANLVGDGTLQLDLNADGSGIKSVGSNIEIAAGYSAGQGYVLDHTKPHAPSLALAVDSGVSNTDGVTSYPTVNVLGLEPGSSWQYSLNGGIDWAAGTNSSFDLAVGAYAAGDVQVRQTDAAGNTSAAGQVGALAVDTQAATGIVLSNSEVRNVAGLNAVVGNLDSTDAGANGAPFIYALVSGLGDTDNALFSIVDGQLRINDAAAVGSGLLSVRVSTTDAAGNVFAQTLSISVTQNQSPQLAGLPVETQAVTVGVAAALPDFSVTDIDGDAVTVTLTPSNGTLGQLAAGVFDAVTVTLVEGSYILQGPAAAINALLAGATFTATAAGAAAVVIGVSDGFLPQPVTQSYALLATARPTTPVDPVEPTNPTNPTNPPQTIDGVQVGTRPGEAGTTITDIAVVAPSRNDDPTTPDATLADVPVVKATDGHSILEVGMPVGVGVQAQGVASGLRGAAALNELLARIESAGGDAEQLGLGRVFDNAVSPTTTLHIQTLTLRTGSGFDPSVPFVVRGSALPGDGQQAVILDASALPTGSVIQVDNVDFIAVIGNVRLIGGAGQNMASGDNQNQWIVLGADDDILHGGGGQDSVGSLGGNDQVFGDAGNDIVFGGTGHDTLSGGTGNDRLDGGLGWDTALQSGSLADYTLATDGQVLVFTHRTTGEVDRLKSIEQVKFDSGPALYIADSDAEAAVAHIATRWLDRAPTALEGAWAQENSGLTALQVAEVVLQAAPALFPGRTAQELVAGLQDNAQIVRMDVIPELNQGTAAHEELRVELNRADVHLVRTGSDRWEGTSLIDGNMAESIGIERLHLKDVSVALDTQGTAGEVAALLAVTFGSEALTHQGLAGAGLAALDAGMSVQALGEIAMNFVQTQQGHAFTAQETVQWLWTHATGSAGSVQQLQPLVQQLQNGQIHTGDLVNAAAQFALGQPSAELVGVLDHGLFYTA